MDYIDTLLTNSDANAFFGVESHSFPFGSTVLEATLRYVAVVHCPENIEKVKLIKVQSSTFSPGARGNDFAASMMESSHNILIVESRNGAELPYIDKEGWIALDTPPYPVAPFLSKASATAVFLNRDAQKVILFVKRVTERWIDEFCSSLFRILPWIYTENYRLTEGELALFKAAHDKDSPKFTKVVNELAQKYDFKSMMMARTLIGWNNHFREAQIRTLESKCDKARNNIAAQEQAISTSYMELDALLFNLNAMLNQPADTNEALFNFFKTHKQLGVYRVQNSSNGKTLYYTITETIEYYDEDAFVRVRDNPNSYFNTSTCGAEVREVFNAVFALNKGKFRVEAMFTLNNLSSINAQSGMRSGGYDETHLPHPHIYHHACLGGNRDAIARYMNDGDWDLAIEQTIAAAKNVNFGDSTVVSKMLRDVAGRFESCRCIVADNGTEMTPREFLNYIRTAENNEGDNNG